MSADIEAKGLTVALEADLRDADLRQLVNAIKRLRGVEAVQLIRPESNDWFDRKRVRAEVWTAMHEAMDRVLNGKDGT